MTEAEWLTCADPEPMLRFASTRGRVSERKMRLFAVACCRRILRKVEVHPWVGHCVDIAERYADGEAELQQAAAGPPPEWLVRVEDWLSRLQASLAAAGTTRWPRSLKTATSACWNTTEIEGGIVMADCAAFNAAWATAAHEAVPPDDNGLSPVFNARLAAE